jgi:ABC-2 type transport system ATP-binding protein
VTDPAPPARDAAVRTVALRKTFGDLVAVDHLDLEIARGEVFGLLGPNGSGKTTTIRMLCGLLPPTSGDATVVGCNIRTDSELLRNRIGYMSQRFGLYGELTVRENCRFYASLYGLRGAEREARIDELLQHLDLGARVNDRADTLSGGLKQRVALACAIAHHPQLLFLDEPTAGVDPAARRAFWRIIYDLAEQGTTIVVSTHYMDEAAKLKRIAMLSRGHLIAIGSPAEVTAQFKLATIEDVFIEMQRRDEGAVA